MAEKPKKDRQLEMRMRAFSQSINNFACRLLRDIPDRDVTLAPASLVIQLGSLREAVSDQESYDRSMDVLFGGLSNALADAAREFFKESKDCRNFKWYSALAFIVPSGSPVQVEFTEKMRTEYGIQVCSADMNQDERGSNVIALVNESVENGANGYLKEMIDRGLRLPVDEHSMVAVNGVYFHPWWTRCFLRKKTTQAAFYDEAHLERSVQMMHYSGTLQYVQGEVSPGVGVRLAGMRCRRGSGTVFFVLPQQRFGLRDVIQQLTGDALTELIQSTSLSEVELYVPKTYTYGVRMLQEDVSRTFPLEARLLFDAERANLTGMVENGAQLRVAHLLHQVVIRINEGGEPWIPDEEEQRKEKVMFRCDEPFLVVFQHEPTKAFWFVAAVHRPRYVKKE